MKRKLIILGIIVALAIPGILFALGENHGCEGKEDGSVVPYPYDLTKYYVCMFGEASIQQCPAGLEFDPNLLQCNYPSNIIR